MVRRNKKIPHFSHYVTMYKDVSNVFLTGSQKMTMIVINETSFSFKEV